MAFAGAKRLAGHVLGEAAMAASAPAPIAPVSARASGAPAYDTTDPRSVKSMSTSDWIEAERLRQIKKYEAQRRR